MDAYIHIVHGEWPWRHILIDSELREIGEFTRENVGNWVYRHEGVYMDRGTYPWDFHAVYGDIDIPWKTEIGREAWEYKGATFVTNNAILDEIRAMLPPDRCIAVYGTALYIAQLDRPGAECSPSRPAVAVKDEKVLAKLRSINAQVVVYGYQVYYYEYCKEFQHTIIPAEKPQGPGGPAES